MADFTKIAIMNTFLKCLNKRPFNKITVKEIVQACGVNRNTFYYHFSDIYDLLEKTVNYQLSNLNLNELKPENYRETLEKFLQNVQKQKEAALHVYNSIDLKILLPSLRHVLWQVLENYFTPIFEEKNVSEKDRHFFLTCLTDLMIGFGLEWAQNNFSEEFSDELIDRFLYWLEQINKLGPIRNSIEESEE